MLQTIIKLNLNFNPSQDHKLNFYVDQRQNKN